jgi:hypothetical protein
VRARKLVAGRDRSRSHSWSFKTRNGGGAIVPSAPTPCTVYCVRQYMGTAEVFLGTSGSRGECRWWGPSHVSNNAGLGIEIEAPVSEMTVFQDLCPRSQTLPSFGLWRRRYRGTAVSFFNGPAQTGAPRRSRRTRSTIPAAARPWNDGVNRPPVPTVARAGKRGAMTPVCAVVEDAGIDNNCCMRESRLNQELPTLDLDSSTAEQHAVAAIQRRSQTCRE